MSPRAALSLSNFFFSLYASLIGYILLPYLSQMLSARTAGFIVAGGALLAIFLFPSLPHIVMRFGAQRTAIALSLSIVLCLLVVAGTPGTLIAAVAIAVAFSFQPLLAYPLDLLLEATMEGEQNTGRIRSLFITAWNGASLSAPLLLGFFLAGGDDYLPIFLVSALAFTPFIYVFFTRRFPLHSRFTSTALTDTLRCMSHSRDLTMVTLGHFLFYCFAIWGSLYVPSYLHNVLHVSWTDMSWIFFIMLLPYVFVEYPAGWLADRFIGEKQLLLAGFLIAGGALVSLSLLQPGASLLLIAGILFLSRVGAALIESMTEVHFFRRVSENDVNSISIFRGVWPVANVVGPLVGSAILTFGTYTHLFAITGCILAFVGGIATLFVRNLR